MHLITHTTAPTSRKSSLTTLVLLIGLGVAWQPARAAPSQPVNPPCTSLSGTFVFTLFQFTSATTAYGEVEVWADGEVVAYGTAQYFNIAQKGKGVIQINGQHVVTFLDGSALVTHDEILLQSDNQDPAYMQANSRLYIGGVVVRVVCCHVAVSRHTVAEGNAAKSYRRDSPNARKRRRLFARGERAPDAHRLAGGNQQPAIRREGHLGDVGQMPFQDGDLPVGGKAEQLEHAILGPDGERLAFRRHGQAQHDPRFGSQHVGTIRVEVPQMHPSIQGARAERVATRQPDQPKGMPNGGRRSSNRAHGPYL
jgi:hypothetical protein